MATTATNLDNIKVNYPSMLDQYDNRLGDYGLLRKANENSNMAMGVVTNDLKQKAMNSWGRTVDIPVMEPTAGGISSGLVCTPTDDVAISKFMNVTWVSVSMSWFMEPSLNEQNEISYLEMWLNQYRAKMNVIYDSVDSSIDTALIAALAPESNYSNSMIGLGNKYGALTAARIDVSLAQRELFLNDMTSINKSDDIFGRQDLIGSTNAESILRNTYAQGQANDTNTAFQAGLFDATFSNNVTVGAVSDASAYVVPKGSFGIVYRNHPDCAAGRSTTSGKQYSTVYDPVFGADIDVTFQSVCADINAKTGNALDVANVQELHQVNVNFGIITPANSFGLGASVAPGGVIRGFNFQTA